MTTIIIDRTACERFEPRLIQPSHINSASQAVDHGTDHSPLARIKLVRTNAVVCDRAFDRGEPGHALGKKVVGMLTGRGRR
ncbi:MAG TPA: hypothetical protein VFO55_04520 [Gemmatimonadaceae bacterium]|nr:hypothetical protein [Gemmatimonadaceae bacterium]